LITGVRFTTDTPAKGDSLVCEDLMRNWGVTFVDLESGGVPVVCAKTSMHCVDYCALVLQQLTFKTSSGHTMFPIICTMKLQTLTFTDK